MTRITDWTGAAGNGVWFDPANWSAGVPGRHAAVTFHASGQPAIDVSLAPAHFHHPVAGSVMVDAGRFVFEPGKLVIGQGGLAVDDEASLTIARGAIVDARNTLGGAAMSVSAATLDVHGTLRTDSLDVQVGADGSGLMLVSGAGARAAVAGQANVAGALLEVNRGAQFTAATVNIFDEYQYSGDLVVQGTTTVARLGSLNVYDSFVQLQGGARLFVGNGTEALDVNKPYSSAYISITHAELQLTGLFQQQGGTLQDGGQLVLAAGATFEASGTVTLAGGTITGPGALILAGGTLQADGPSMQVLDHALALSGSGTVAAPLGETLRLDGAVSGPKAVLQTGGTFGELGEGTVVLTNTADSYGRTDLAGGTLELAANDVAGSGPIRFLAGDSATLQVDAGISVGNTLLGFGAGDTIDLAGIAYGPRTTLDLVPRLYGGATLTVSDGTHAEHLVLGTVGNPAGYTLASDGHGGTDVGYAPPPQSAG